MGVGHVCYDGIRECHCRFQQARIRSNADPIRPRLNNDDLSTNDDEEPGMIGDEAMEEDKHKAQTDGGQGPQGELRDGASANVGEPVCE